MTRNEKVQAILKEAVEKAEALNMPKRSQDFFCAAYISGRYVELKEQSEFSLTDCAYVKKWMRENRLLVQETINNLDVNKLADLIDDPQRFHAYIALAIVDEIIYHEPDDAQPDHAAEEDMRERVRDYRLDEIEVC